jgi:SAM-dependent methyltransferase
MMHTTALTPAAAAFDAMAERFDERFGAWLSVSAQRRAVRAALCNAFPVGSDLIELGGGTGDDASWLAARGRRVLLTDPSPTMARIAEGKLRPLGMPSPIVVPAERLESLADEREQSREPLLDGAFSNFAGLNCVVDLSPVGRALGRMIKPGGRALLVIFGTCPPGEWIVQLAKGDRRAAFRRASRGDVPARLQGREFVVRYHRAGDVSRAMAPWFRLVRRRGIGVFVPPSAAEPAISRHPALLNVLERIDRVVSRPLAMFGDHVLYDFERTSAT